MLDAYISSLNTDSNAAGKPCLRKVADLIMSQLPNILNVRIGNTSTRQHG